MAQHTAGPWKADDNDVRAPGLDEELLATAYSMDCDLNKEDAWETARRNAHLIAASPDLYEACRKALTCASIDSSVRELIRAALDKAEGR